MAVFVRLTSSVVVLACVVGAQSAAQDPPAPGGRVYVAVMDRSGKPVAARPVEAFHVWEDGTKRDVVSASRASKPVSVVIVVHGITYDATQSVRRALRSIVETFRQADPNTRVAIVTSVQTPRLVGARSGSAELEDAINKFVVSGPGLLLIEALADASNVLAKEETDRRIILAISYSLKTDGAAASAEQASLALTRAKASLWAIHLTADSQKSNRAATDFEKENALTNWSIATGGLNETVFGTTGLPGTAEGLSKLILSQYEVLFSRPPGAGAGALRVGVAGAKGERVVAPAWPIK